MDAPGGESDPKDEKVRLTVWPAENKGKRIVYELDNDGLQKFGSMGNSALNIPYSRHESNRSNFHTSFPMILWQSMKQDIPLLYEPLSHTHLSLTSAFHFEHLAGADNTGSKTINAA